MLFILGGNKWWGKIVKKQGAYRSAAEIPPNARHLRREGREQRVCQERDLSHVQ